MSKVFSVDVMIFATAYIKAESAEEAAQILADMDTGLEFRDGQEIAPGLEISGERFDSEDLPEFSLSPAMTAYPLKLGVNPSSLSPIAADDFDLAHDPVEIDDEPDSDAADFRAFCEGATASQLDEIIKKEHLAGRTAFAEIARAVNATRNGKI